MLKFSYRLLLSVSFIFLFNLAACAAEALLKPLPSADTSHLSAANQKELTVTQHEFDAAKPNLVGDPLAEAYVKIGAEYARFGFNDVATVAFHNAAQLSPYDGRWPYLEGVMAMAKKQTALARELFQAAFALDQLYLPIRFRLADVLIEGGDLDGAKKLMDELVKARQDLASAYALLGEIALKQKHYPEAIEQLNHALKLEPQANQLYVQLAQAYAGQGNTKAASDAKELAGPNRPTLIDPLVSGMYGPKISGNAVDQAVALMQQHRFDEARHKLAEALTAKPQDVIALSVAARLEAEDGNLDGAKKAASEALKVDPNGGIANLTQGMVLEMSGDEVQATGLYEKAMRADMKLPEARLLLGNAKMRQGQFSQAAEQYRQLTTLQPDSAEAYARFAAAQVAAGKCTDAIKDIRRYIEERAKDGNLRQIFVRLVSTCPGTSQADRTLAFDYAKSLYQQHPDASNSEALAIAYAAQGKFKDAEDYQAQAVFDAVRNGDQSAAELYKSMMQRIQSKLAPERPWLATHPYFKPPLLAPGPAHSTNKDAGANQKQG